MQRFAVAKVFAHNGREAHLEGFRICLVRKARFPTELPTTGQRHRQHFAHALCDCPRRDVRVHVPALGKRLPAVPPRPIRGQQHAHRAVDQLIHRGEVRRHDQRSGRTGLVDVVPEAFALRGAQVHPLRIHLRLQVLRRQRSRPSQGQLERSVLRQGVHDDVTAGFVPPLQQGSKGRIGTRPPLEFLPRGVVLSLRPLARLGELRRKIARDDRQSRKRGVVQPGLQHLARMLEPTLAGDVHERIPILGLLGIVHVQRRVPHVLRARMTTIRADVPPKQLLRVMRFRQI